MAVGSAAEAVGGGLVVAQPVGIAIEVDDDGFARWDRSHLYKFEMADGRLIGQVEFDDFDLGFIDGDATTLSIVAADGPNG
ncbi:MAG: hypothetical protein WBW75_10155 [Mycobacterium sp.]|uniref:hypothetical protein n=1 Tax=Mycobacterium sp. TaxID=1785 RepID=UPI003C480BB9